MVNALPICKGSITRVRHTINETEESILDYFIVCNHILPLVNKMKIDVDGIITLTRFRGKVVKSDHLMLQLEILVSGLIFEGFRVQNPIKKNSSFERSFWAKAPLSIYLFVSRQLVCYKFYN